MRAGGKLERRVDQCARPIDVVDDAVLHRVVAAHDHQPEVVGVGQRTMPHGVMVACDFGENGFAAILVVFGDRARVARIEQPAIFHRGVTAVVQTEGGAEKVDPGNFQILTVFCVDRVIARFIADLQSRGIDAARRKQVKRAGGLVLEPLGLDVQSLEFSEQVEIVVAPGLFEGLRVAHFQRGIEVAQADQICRIGQLRRSRLVLFDRAVPCPPLVRDIQAGHRAGPVDARFRRRLAQQGPVGAALVNLGPAVAVVGLIETHVRPARLDHHGISDKQLFDALGGRDFVDGPFVLLPFACQGFRPVEHHGFTRIRLQSHGLVRHAGAFEFRRFAVGATAEVADVTCMGAVERGLHRSQRGLFGPCGGIAAGWRHDPLAGIPRQQQRKQSQGDERRSQVTHRIFFCAPRRAA